MFLDKLIGVFSSDIAIDLGTANTVVIVKGKGIQINEPSVVAVQRDAAGRSHILAVGREAKEMVGKTPGNIVAIRPMRDGVIADFEMTERMIRYFIEKVHNRRAFVRPRVVVGVPYGVTQVERKAIKESAMSAGARAVFLIEEPMAAAIGAGLPVKEPKGSLVVDIGGGTTEIGVVSLGGLVISKSIRVAGDKLDMAIVDYIKRKHNLLIGERLAEEIKIKIGNAVAYTVKPGTNDDFDTGKEKSSNAKEPEKMFVKGRDQLTGSLATIEFTSDDAREAIKDTLKDILDALKSVLEITPPDLAGDIVENGIILAGGGALLKGLDKYLSEATKLPVYIAEDPLLAVAKGAGRVLEEIDLLQQFAYE
ncbi:rod shape-determining protein [Campylobacterota bacterium]|nr:rod shape-determining protein [Campylobacterota bacterium]GHV04138.1 rod shape-determining protein [Campylobacterota bacterium]